MLGGIILFVFLEENTCKAISATGNLSENHAVLCCTLSPRACTPVISHVQKYFTHVSFSPPEYQYLWG